MKQKAINTHTHTHMYVFTDVHPANVKEQSEDVLLCFFPDLMKSSAEVEENETEKTGGDYWSPQSLIYSTHHSLRL